MIDASVILAILLDEPESDEWLAAIRTMRQPFTTAAALAEAALRLENVLDAPAGATERILGGLLKELGIAVRDLPAASWVLAADAAHRFGKGRHPAALNFGDCLAYAAARHFEARLIYKGDDFARTDVNDGY